ncbi:MAG TPA: hypothetical protein VKF16_05760 [Candidatus Dormibacteraeota bacterium]|nr:hypothetical protein [Candidatus Dormibacteraeota bacterium]
MCALSLGLLFTRPAPESYDAQIMFQVTQSVVDHGSFTVYHDPFSVNIPYSVFGIGMSLLMALPYWVAEHLHQGPGTFVMAVNAAVVAAIAAAVFALGLATRATARQSLAAAALTVFGTLLLPYVATGFSEPSVALAIALGLIGVQTNRPVVTGAAAGLALLMRVDSALLVVPVLGVAAWVAGARSWQAALRFSVALMPAAIVTAAYDTLRFGAPWRAGYFFATFNHPLVAGLYGLLLSPAAGLFIYVPMLPIALVGLFLAMRRLPLLVATAAVLLAVRFPFYAVWTSWSAYWAWGPRYLVPAMPVLAVGLVEVCRRWSGLHLGVKAALALVLAVSSLVQVVGAAVGYDHAVMFSAMLRAHPPVLGPGFVVDESLPSTQAVFDRVLFDWSLWPIPDEARDLVQGRYLSSHWLAPTPNLTVIAALLICGALAGAVAVAAARWSDRRAKAAPG